MRVFISVLVILTLLNGPAAFSKPKQPKAAPTATPHPKMWLVSFTFTMTDFAFRRMANAEGLASGMAQPICGGVSGLLPVGSRMNFVWSSKGQYANPGDPDAYHITFCASRYDSAVADVPDITADIVRDIFGADAISDVREIPYEEFQRQQQTKERVQIIQALKLSAGNVPQAAVRLGMREADLREKMVRYGIDNAKR